MTWLGRGQTIGGGAAGGSVASAPYPFIAPRNTEANDSTWDLRFNALNGSGGGGTNLTYTIKSKKTFGTEATLASGNASAFPKDLTVTRDPRQDQVITFTVTDAATGLFANASFDVPAFVPAVTPAGHIGADFVDAGAAQRAATYAELPAGTLTKTLTLSNAAFFPENGPAATYQSNQDGIQSSASQVFIAFVPLPQGVTITLVEMVSIAPSPGASNVLELYRQNVAAYSTGTLIGTVTRAISAGDTGGTNNSGALSELVSANTYCLVLTIAGTTHIVQKVVVTYTMPSYDKAI
jgi:hypothetical protein